MDALSEAARGAAAWTPGSEARFTRFRGDGWQVHVSAPPLALRTALALVAALRASDAGLATRIAIGIGRVEGLGTDTLADAHGPAFETSGRSLDHMPRTRRLTIEGDGVTPLHRVVVELLDDRTGRLSREQAQALAQALLDRVGLADKAQAYPRQLFGGQQQRVAIARALALRPKVLLFDEPTSALDPELVGEVLDVIKKLARSGTTLVVVTHEIGFAREVADQVVFMVDGRIVEQGSSDEVLNHPQHPRTRQFLSRVLPS